MVSTGVTVAVLVLALATSAAVAAVSHRRDAPMSTGLTVAALGAAGRIVAELLAFHFGWVLAVEAASLACSTLIITGWAYLVAHYTDNEWAVRDGRVLLLAAPQGVPAAVYVVEAAYAAGGGTGGLAVADLGVFDGILGVYGPSLTGATILVLLVRFADEPPIYRRRAAMLAAAPLMPIVVTLLYNAGIVTISRPLGIATYAVTSAVALYALAEYDLLEIVPLARETTVNNIDDAVIAVTSDGAIASVNDPGKEMLSVTDAVVGCDLADSFARWPAVVEAVESGTETRVRVDDRHVKLSLTAIGPADRRLGTVVQLTDVSSEVEQREALLAKQRQLERTNEQLDEVVSVVSHDIRNPLSVAQGHVDLLAESVDREESVEAIRDAHERIEAIVGDLLHLARQGKRVSEPTDVDFVEVAERARATTAVDADAFECTGPGTVTADPSRLRQLLENLFRNSVDHGGEDVAVTVGPIADGRGFFVEDDGPGISRDERDAVFEYGYTNRDGGTGLGLSIVESIADAHGWRVRLCEGRAGGARFEFLTDDQEAGPAADERTRDATAP